MFRLIAAAAVTAGLASSVAAAPPPPASAFGRLPAVQDAEISPNGERIALIGGGPSDRMVAIATVDQPQLPRLRMGDVETIGLRWAGDDFVLARVAYWDKIGVRAADTYRFERHIVVNTRAEAVGRLLQSESSTQYSLGQRVLGVVAEPKPTVYVTGLSWNAPDDRGDIDTRIPRKGAQDTFSYTLWRTDVASGKTALVERADVNTDGWVLDLTGEPRVRIDTNYATHLYSLYGRPKGAKIWKGIIVDASEEDERNFLGYSDPDDAVYLVKDGQILLKRLSDGSTTPLGKSVAGGIDLTFDRYRGTAVAITGETDKPQVEWLDPELGAAHAALAGAFKGLSVALMNWSRDRTRFVLRTSAPNSPPVWYLYDKPRKEISLLGEEYPELKGQPMGETRWLVYKARDGLDIPAYVTLPPGAQAGAKLPLIVFPHGGPAARDDYEFDFWAQFMASRGYAVLQPQFRGSWGFGLDFENAGRHEWGGKMQTDLLDGIAALAAQGQIDPSRVCIVGASYGGYAALAGAALHPDAYKCAAAIAGVADLALFVGERGRSYGRDSGNMRYWQKLLGEGGAANPELVAASPRQQAAKVRAPVLLIHGDQDTVVLPEQSQLMFETLQKAGKDVQYVVLKGEDHYLSRSATRTQMLEALEVFLAKNLPAN